MAETSPYVMRVSLSVLDDLGINLYSNMAAVLSEVVANAWDADASKVTVELTETEIVIRDNGHGMSIDEINDRFLHVGYRRREAGRTTTPKFKRPVMGRKGIGKLSLFAIAEEVTVATRMKGTPPHCFVLKTDEIRDAIDAGQEYRPTAGDPRLAPGRPGTVLRLARLKKTADERTGAALRQRLARRFSVVGGNSFNVVIDGKKVTVKDRRYWRSVQYLWVIGDPPDYIRDLRKRTTKPKPEKSADIDGWVDKERGWKASGWIGTVAETRSLEEAENNLPVLARGKLIHEDLLTSIRQGGFVTKYIVGELRVDFVDDDKGSDIATSDRQSLRETDERYVALVEFVTGAMRTVNTDWTRWRRESATKKARQYPSIDRWFQTLTADGDRKAAEKLFERIGALPLEKEEDRKELYKHGILAFERLRITDLLGQLETLGDGDVESLLPVFAGIDDVEAVLYAQIARGRLEVIQKLTDLVDGDAKERAIQTHLFNHLWLLSTSWERSTSHPQMEKRVDRALGVVTKALGDKEKLQRLDIAYKTPPGAHVVIELKRYSANTPSYELHTQMSRYRTAVRKVLQEHFPNEDPDVEVIAVVGRRPSDVPWEEYRQQLAAIRSSVVTYDELIEDALDNYREYLEADERISSLTELFRSLDAEVLEEQ